MSLLSQISDAFLRLFGLRKDKPTPPHTDFWNQFQGYFAYDHVCITGEDATLNNAVSRVIAEMNRGAREAGLPYLFSGVERIPNVTNILVRWDNQNKVARGEDATTPPGEIIGVRPDMPWAVKSAVVYARKGKSGGCLYRLLLHETLTHAALAGGEP